MLRHLRRSGRRIWYVLGFAVQRTIGKLFGSGSRRLALTLGGVAISIMLMTTVTGVALGLASQSAIEADNVDYWIVPEQGDLNTIAVSTEGPRLGSTHDLTAQLRDQTSIEYVTPVLLQIVQVRHPASGSEAYVLFVGVVVPSEAQPDIVNLPTAPLTSGDPYYADGQYNGTWTGELVASSTTATTLNASEGDRLVLAGESASTNHSFRVTTVADTELTTGAGTTPVALVHLSELQTLTGAQSGDIADQLLVSTNDRGVRSDLETLYPRTEVVTRTGLSGADVSTTSLPIAMGIAAFVVALAVGVLFTATMMGLEVSQDRQTLAVLAGLGYSKRSLTLVVVAETVSLSLLGGGVGVVLGIGGIHAINYLLTTLVGLPAVAVFRPALLSYGLGTALLIGLIAAPYPAWLLRRTAMTRGLHL